jgi:predicted transcriptional regulator
MPSKKRFGTTLNAACTEDMKARVEALASRQDRLPADVIRAAVGAYLTKEEGRKKAVPA